MPAHRESRVRPRRVALTGDRAVMHLAQGGLVAFPTETVWGLGADASNPEAVRRLQQWKGRSADQPLSVLVTDLDHLREFAPALPAGAERLAAQFWPGPLTLVVPAAPSLAPGVAREDGALGVRCSPHPVAAGLAKGARACGLGPVVATSLNATGQPPAASRADAERLCAAEDAPLLVAGEDAGGAAPSTVVDLCGPAPRVLRAGALDPEAVSAASRDPEAP